jgi:quercetin dioxygenase-like cupin family protein
VGRRSCARPKRAQLLCAVDLSTENESYPSTEVSMFARALSPFHRSRILLLGVIVAVIAATPAAAQKAKEKEKSEKAEKSGKLSWMKGPDFLPPGAMMAVISGDPSKSGPFAIELSFPNGYRIAPHSHPTAEKVTVKSGEFMYGMGDVMKASDMKAMKPGNSGEIPAGMHHYAEARGKTVVQINSTGPFVINYVHAKDDPRTKTK